MKTYARLVVTAIVAALVLAGCGVPLSPVQQGEALATGAASLPPDEIRDVSRSVSGPFTFETLLSVDVRLSVDLYETDEAGRVVGDPLAPDAADVFVTLDDSEGNRVFAGMTGDDGTLEASVQLPSAAEDMKLTIRADGFETRTIEIDDMVTFELIDRILSLARFVSDPDGPASRSVAGSGDADGDGVPDSEDAEPDDPTIAFYAYVPSREAITVAYEDLFGREDAGDADYNDFIASYTIREGLNAAGNVTEIYVAAEAVQKLAGYDHRFGIRLDSFEGTASVSGSFIDLKGTSRDYSFRPLVDTAEIDLFVNSRYAKDKTAEFTVTFDEPQVRDGREGALPKAPYNPYLFVYNTGHDIHLVGREPNTVSKNPDDPFVDEKGFPWALLVPRNWVHPDEGVRIEVDYPRFTLWRESGGTEHQDWYDHYQDPYEPGGGGDATVYVAGYYNNGTQDRAVLWVLEPGVTMPVPTELSLPAGVSTGTDARANDVFVDGTDVYVAGFYGDRGAKRATVWRNGVPTTLSAIGQNAEATSVQVADGVVYAAGTLLDGQSGTPILWRDGGAFPLLGSPADNGAATGVVVSGDAAVVAGTYDNGTTPYTATLWQVSAGGSVEELVTLSPGENGEALAIDLGSDRNYYVSGSLFNGTNFTSVSWVVDASGVAGAPQTLASADTVNSWSKAFGIDEESGTVYAAGYYPDGGDRPGYWTGASRTALSGGSIGRALAIDAAGGTVYVGGFYVDSGVRRAVLWIDSEDTLLSDANAVSAEARGAFAVTR